MEIIPNTAEMLSLKMEITHSRETTHLCLHQNGNKRFPTDCLHENGI
jgi:hypothetical protein